VRAPVIGVHLSAVIQRNILAVAWAVLLGAFAVFAGLAIELPRAGLQYLRAATLDLDAEVRVTSGDVEVCAPRCMRRMAGDIVRVREKTTIRPLGGGGSTAMVRFFDGSQVTLDGYGILALEQMRRPRFAGGEAAHIVQLRLRREERAAPGTIAVLRFGTRYVERPDESPRQFMVDLPSARLEVDPSSHARLELDTEELRVFGEEGTVHIFGKGATIDAADSPARKGIAVGPGERTLVRADGLPLPADADPENLLGSSDMDEPPGLGVWQIVPPAVDFVSPPEVQHEPLFDNRSVLRFRRTDSQKSPADIVVRSDLGDFPINDATYVAVTATLRIREQSLPGGGDKAEEYPLLLSLVAVDSGGDEFVWSIGFYALVPDPSASEFSQARVREGRDRHVSWDQWTTFDSGNLLNPENPLSFARLPIPRQATRLKRVELKASGHDFVTEVDAVAVLWK
jgi:hypothetical protein